MVAQALENAAYNAVAARVDLDAGLVAVGFGGVADGVGVDGSVVELYAVGYALHIVFRYVAVAPHVVYLLLDEFRMCELRCKITVVGEQEHAGGIAVETADGVDALVAGALHEVHHRKTSVGVVAGGDTVLGLVEQDVAFTLHCHYLLIVFHHVAVGDLGAEFGHDNAVDLHQALLDKFVGLAARAYARVAHILVEAHLLVGIRNGHFVFHGLGTRREALAAGRETTLLTVLIAALAVVVISALTVILEGALSVIVLIASLTVVVISALAIVLIASLAVIVAALLTLLALAVVLIAALAVVVISALLTLLIVILTRLIRTRLVGAGLICLTLLAALGTLLAVLEVGSQRTRLVGTRLIAVVVIVVIVSLLITVVIAALLTGLIRSFGAEIAIFTSLGTLIAGTFLRSLAFRYAEGLPDARAFGFLFVRIRFHNCLAYCITSR